MDTFMGISYAFSSTWCDWPAPFIWGMDYSLSVHFCELEMLVYVIHWFPYQFYVIIFSNRIIVEAITTSNLSGISVCSKSEVSGEGELQYLIV
jgi:hypothetical protein